MGRKRPTNRELASKGTPRRVTLKDVAKLVGLSPTTVSLVLNQSPVAKSIPIETQERVLAAAHELRYRPNYLAKSLRSRRSHTIGVLVPEIEEPYAAGLMGGLEEHLLAEGYFYLLASHQSKNFLLDEYLDLLKSRLVEGLVLMATPLPHPPGLPTVSISGHESIEGVTNVVIDHQRAAFLALTHLGELGHERIALFKGQPGNTDTEDRWNSVLRVAGELGLRIDPELCFELGGDPSSKSRTADAYRDGYSFGRELLERGRDFTAVFGFNDVSAIGATRSFADAGLQIPRDVSVVGFDDILSAGFQNPGLTTVRQPLREMGATAGRILLDRLGGLDDYGDFVTVQPELVVRGSTGPAPRHRRWVAAG